MKKLTSLLLALALMMSVFGGIVTASAAPAADAVFAGGWPYSTMPTGHFNMFVSNAIELKYFRELHQLALSTYEAATDTYSPLLAESWESSADNTTFTVNLKEGVKWHNGDDFTSRDVWTTFMIYKLVGNPVWNYITSIDYSDPAKAVFEVGTPTSLLLRYVLRKPIVDFATYGEYAQRVQALVDANAATDSEEWKTLVNDFNMFRPEMCNATGPYYLDPANVTESCVELLLNESSFLADTVNFSKVIVYNGDLPDLTPLVMSGEIDFLTHQFPAATMETFAAMGYSTLQVAGVDGIALYFNENVKPLDSKEVRQAIAYVIDRSRIGELALPGVSRGTKYVTGLGDSVTEAWVDTAKLIDYTVNTEKAAELLTAAGLTKNNGQWMLANGTPFTLSLQCPSTWADGTTACTEAANQLTAFGIKTTVDGIDGTMRQANIVDGNYVVCASFWGSGQSHPMFAFENPLLNSNLYAAKGLSYPMVQETANGTVDLAAALAASTAGWDVEAQRAAIESIVYTVNETVPYLPLYSKYSKYVSSEGLRTDWGENTQLYKNSAGDDSFVVIKILTGELKPLH